MTPDQEKRALIERMADQLRPLRREQAARLDRMTDPRVPPDRIVEARNG